MLKGKPYIICLVTMSLAVAVVFTGCLFSGDDDDDDGKRDDSVMQLEGNIGGVYSVAMSPGGTYVASGGLDGFRLWDRSTGDLLMHKVKPTGRWARVFDFISETHVLLETNFGLNGVFDVTTGEIVQEIPDWLLMAATKESYVIRQHSPGDTTVTYEVRSIADGSLLSSIVRQDTMYYTSAHLTPDGRWLSFDIRPYMDVEIWNTTEETLKRRISVEDYTPGQKFARSIPSIACTPDGAFLITGGNVLYPRVSVWSVETGERIRRHKFESNCVAISPSGTYYAANNMYETAVDVWNLQTGECIAELEYPNGTALRSLIFCSDNTLISGHETNSVDGSIFGDNNVRVWEIR